MAAASSMPAPGFCSSVAKAHSVFAISCEVYWCSITAARRAAMSSTRCPGLYPSLLYDHRLLQIACSMTRQCISQSNTAGPQTAAYCLRHYEEVLRPGLVPEGMQKDIARCSRARYLALTTCVSVLMASGMDAWDMGSDKGRACGLKCTMLSTIWQAAASSRITPGSWPRVANALHTHQALSNTKISAQSLCKHPHLHRGCEKSQRALLDMESLCADEGCTP